MKRILLAVTIAGLALAPAAAAKGPHVILTTPRETVEPGKPWQFTVELNEFRDPPRPAMIGRNGGRTIGASVDKAPASMQGATGFRFTMIFPREGRWRLRMFAGKRRFVFPAVEVGGKQVPQDYVAFPIGSEAARQGAGGVYTTDEAPAADTAGGGALPPETVDYADATAADDGSGAGIGPWILPLLGVVLAGAGVAAVTRRGSR
jgi:hypothetical protein